MPWQPELLAGTLSELLTVAEDGRVAQYVAKCEEAGLLPKLIKEIERDVHFPPVAKTMLKSALPRLAAKWLNKSGVSAEWQDEITVLSAFVLIVLNDRKISGKLDELIAEKKKKEAEASKPTPPAL